jgi:restriction system protein
MLVSKNGGKLMARKKESILDILALFPWWVSVCVAIFAYVGLKLIVPGIAFENPVLASLAPLSSQLAWIAAIIFLIPAVESVLKPSSKPRQHYHQSRAKVFRPFSLPTFSSRSRSINSEVIMHHESEEKKEEVDLSVETLKKIEWYSFELFCKIYYENIGYRVIKTKAGADGGIDLILYQADSESSYALVQCKARMDRDIGVNYVRELLGVMTAEKVEKGILITNSYFTKEAIEFAKNHSIEMIDLFRLSTLVNELETEKQLNLVNFLESTDYTTPTCPNCEVKLVERITKKGKYIGQRFWGCRNYPRCNYKLRMH